jgi:hypothetical protein
MSSADTKFHNIEPKWVFLFGSVFVTIWVKQRFDRLMEAVQEIYRQRADDKRRSDRQTEKLQAIMDSITTTLDKTNGLIDPPKKPTGPIGYTGRPGYTGLVGNADTKDTQTDTNAVEDQLRTKLVQLEARLVSKEEQLVQLKLFQHSQLYRSVYKDYTNNCLMTSELPFDFALYKQMSPIDKTGYACAMAIVIIMNRLYVKTNYKHMLHLYPLLDDLNKYGQPYGFCNHIFSCGHTLQSLEQYIRNLSGNDFAGLSDNPSDNDALCRSVLTHVKEISERWRKQSDISWTFTE